VANRVDKAICVAGGICETSDIMHDRERLQSCETLASVSCITTKNLIVRTHESTDGQSVQGLQFLRTCRLQCRCEPTHVRLTLPVCDVGVTRSPNYRVHESQIYLSLSDSEHNVDDIKMDHRTLRN